MKRFTNWLWKIGNKKPPTLLDAYANVAICWWFSGCLFGVAMAIFMLLTKAKDITSAIVGGIALLLFSLWFIYDQVSWDKRHGYRQVLKDFAVKRWHKRRQELGLEEKPHNEVAPSI